MINIIRKGIWPIPKEAKRCPVCKELAQNFMLQRLQGLYQNRCQCVDATQMYPTMICKVCDTVWQYLGENEEEKENE